MKQQADSTPIQDLELPAHGLAERLPALLIEASRVAQTVAHGIHGRRRAGPGETFWQFRQFERGDGAPNIDWRRSASSDHLYIREREWEAAHTLWIWPDLSPSMNFRSHLAEDTKRDRAVVLAFATGELASLAGERIGLLGGDMPAAGRYAIQKIAMSMARQEQNGTVFSSLPPRAVLRRFTECVLFSDFLDPPEQIEASCQHIAAQGVRGNLVQIFDPAEETLPYHGRVEFAGIENGERLLAGRAEDLRQRYMDRLAAQKAAVTDVARRLQWSYMLHHTGRPAGEALLALHTQLSGQASDYRSTASIKAKASESAERTA
ncbi:MAG TPA: DUF58 domain-containing protein [Hyphomicrobiales bacterium]|nr:DUF58 domain-containing protein [Hyphomicrobiales bacterium]